MEACGNQLNGSNTIEYLLPDEIISDILLRLPVKSLLRFSCVCKTWMDLISSSYFIKANFEISKNSKNYANHRVVFYSEKRPYSTFTCPLPSILDNNATLNPNPLYDPTSSRNIMPWMYGSCNGLLCVKGDNSTVVLYNPATRKSKILPPSGTTQKVTHCSPAYGICYHELDDDYRVVELHKSYYNYAIEVNIYSLKTNSWRKINGDEVLDKDTWKASACRLRGLPVGGVLHWLLQNDDNLSLRHIFVVDIVTYRYGTLAGPKYVGTTQAYSDIMDFRGCLGVYHAIAKTGVDIWIMKESWTKVLSVPYSGVAEIDYALPLIGLKTDEILLNHKTGYLVVYNSRESSFIYREIPDLCVFRRLEVYIESLVAPSFDGE